MQLSPIGTFRTNSPRDVPEILPYFWSLELSGVTSKDPAEPWRLCVAPGRGPNGRTVDFSRAGEDKTALSGVIETPQSAVPAEREACAELEPKASFASEISVLVLDPDQAALEAWSRDLGSLGHRAFATADPEEARTVLKSAHPGLFLCDVRALPRNGSRLLFFFPELDPDLPLIILTGLATIELAVEALREGALFYLVRPFTLNNLKMAVSKA